MSTCGGPDATDCVIHEPYTFVEVHPQVHGRWGLRNSGTSLRTISARGWTREHGTEQSFCQIAPDKPFAYPSH